MGNYKPEVVEVRDRVGLRPEADTPCRKSLITKIEDWSLIVQHLSMTATADHMQRVPLIQVDRLAEVLQQVSNPFDDSIDPNVLFQRVSPCQIVIPVIGSPPNETAAHVCFSCNRQEGNLKI